MFTDEQNELCQRISEYALDKLNDEDGWSCLSMVRTGSSINANVYQLDSVDEALDMAHTEFGSLYPELTSYAVAYDGSWRGADGGILRGIIVETEAVGHPPARVGCVIEENSDGIFDFTGEVVRHSPPQRGFFNP